MIRDRGKEKEEQNKHVCPMDEYISCFLLCIKLNYLKRLVVTQQDKEHIHVTALRDVVHDISASFVLIFYCN